MSNESRSGGPLGLEEMASPARGGPEQIIERSAADLEAVFDVPLRISVVLGRTVISTIFLPMTFIAGVYGMNFEPTSSPYNMPELKWRWGYPFALGLMLASAVGLLVFYFRKGWIAKGGMDRDDQPPPS